MSNIGEGPPLISYEEWIGVSILLVDTDTDSIPTGIDTSIDTLGIFANPAFSAPA
jgi:hypothetical protein